MSACRWQTWESAKRCRLDGSSYSLLLAVEPELPPLSLDDPDELAAFSPLFDPDEDPESPLLSPDFPAPSADAFIGPLFFAA
jgi:hypothetical protein